MHRLYSNALACMLMLFCIHNLAAQTQPNILLVIADDLGVDLSNGYHQGNLMPTTPTLDSLRSVGITFENVFSAPVCTPTRAGIMSAKYGIKTGVTSVPGNLDLEHQSLLRSLAEHTNDAYADAVIGKWHISSPSNPQHPMEHGADYYMGLIAGVTDDYFAWNKTENGVTTQENTYITTAFTDAAINWVDQQTQPWFLWFAHVAPHTPLHVPPSHMYTINNTDNNFRKYIAMIESVDYELNRLLNSMSEEERANTLVIYIGDNGTPGNVLQDYPSGHGKGSVYQGGIRVPMIIAGAGVERPGEREAALVHVNDLHATILELAGAELPGGVFNSLSFDHLLSGQAGLTRTYNYSETTNSENDVYAIRDLRYKLIVFEDGTEEMYDLLTDSLEFNNLLTGTLSAEQLLIKDDLFAEATQLRENWSCRDFIQNGDETGIDCGGSQCAECIPTSVADIDSEAKVMVFPNPGTGLFLLRSEQAAIQQVKVYNLVGELLHEQSYTNVQEDVSVDLSHLGKQVLFFQLTTEVGTSTIKVVKM